MSEEEILTLLKAAFAAGFRCGHASGSDSATAYEWGTRSLLPQTPEKAWAQDVEYRLEPSFCSNADVWKDVP